MIIKEITAGELKDFIHSTEYKKLTVVPITRHRALSHINNPRVSPADVVLLLAYVDDKLAGYIGILADKLITKDTRTGWISCFWVDDSTKGKGVAKVLLNKAFELWNNNLMVTQVPEARGTYIRSGLFMDPFTCKGIRGYLRFNLNELLPARNKKFKKFRGVLKATDRLLNVFNDLRIKLISEPQEGRFEYVNEIDAETDKFIKRFHGKNLTKREESELNWIIRFPWVLSAPVSDLTSKRYIFSSLDKQHSLMNIKIYDQTDNVKAFLMISVKGKNMKIPYCYFEPSDVGEVMKLIYLHMLKMNLNMLTTFNPLLREYMLSHKTPFIYKKEIIQEYFISKIFETSLGSLSEHSFQDGDGDCAFT
jgi:hypothetical protein